MNQSNEVAAERLAIDFVDPLLRDKNLIDNSTTVLSDTENRAAYLYLTLQYEDEYRNKGLTKLCYESLIRSILRETDAQNKMTGHEIKDKLCNILPSHNTERVKLLADNALKRMVKKSIRHYPKDDEYCLTRDEIIRLSTELGVHEKSHEALLKYIKEVVLKISEDHYEEVLRLNGNIEFHIEKILQTYLSSRGEKFVASVNTGKVPGLAINDLQNIIIKYISDSSFLKRKSSTIDIIQIIIDVIQALFQSPPTQITFYLRSITDSYTLMAFLREAPDVQDSIKKMFKNGKIWLDTSIVLPLLAEILIDDSDKRQYTNMIKSARLAGLKLRVIDGIIEEINGHINRCMACARTPSSEWMGDTPFLYSLYIQSGRDIYKFSHWIETFKGLNSPEDDLADYIKEFHEIETESLEDDAYSVDLQLRAAIKEIWHEAHEYRVKRKGYEIDEMVVQKLIQHDVENYLGVVKRRETEKRGPLEFSSWWLTLDSTAHMLSHRLSSRIDESSIPMSPVMSLDFFSNYLSVGPLRQVREKTNMALPIFADRNFHTHIPKELIEIATKVREEARDLPEHVIRRKVRDELDKAKRRPGEQVKGGTELLKTNIEKAFEEDTLET